MSKKLGWRPPAGSARAVIAAAGLAVIALIIAAYGNAKAVNQDDGKASGVIAGDVKGGDGPVSVPDTSPNGSAKTK